jgi:site-specific recombinase XerC
MRNSSKKTKAGKGKTTVATVCGIAIRERREGQFIIQVRRKGLNHTETFASLQAATLKCEQLHSEQVQRGLEAFDLSTADRGQAKDAIQKLNGRATLSEVVAFWLDHHPDGEAVPLSEMVEAYLADLEKRKCRPTTITGAKSRLTCLCRDYGSHPVTAITADNLAEWLDVRAAGVNKNNYRTAFRAAFAYGIKRKWLKSNPAAELDIDRADDKTPDHWTAERVEELLRAAQTFRPDMVPMLAIMAFAGLRPFEAQRLDWRQINLSERIIRVLPATTKTRQARAVDITDNLAVWLAPYRQASGAVAPADQAIRRYRVRLAAVAVLGVDSVRDRLNRQGGKLSDEAKASKIGWDDVVEDARKVEPELWPVDILRHSYATNWLPVHSDIYKLSEQMGNSPKVVKAHYQGLATAKEAARYWSIMPDKSAGKIIQLQQKAVGE